MNSMSLVWGALSIVFIICIMFVLLLVKVDVLDVLFSMLSGAFVGTILCTYALYKEPNPSNVSLLFLICIVSSAVAWVLTVVVLKISTLWLIGNAALALDLITGAIGAVSGSTLLFFKTQYINNRNV